VIKTGGEGLQEKKKVKRGVGRGEKSSVAGGFTLNRWKTENGYVGKWGEERKGRELTDRGTRVQRASNLMKIIKQGWTGGKVERSKSWVKISHLKYTSYIQY